jgi:hypothetical protein
MAATASTIAAALLSLWALVSLADQPKPAPAPLAPAAAAPAAHSALGDFRTLSRYPGQ